MVAAFGLCGISSISSSGDVSNLDCLGRHRSRAANDGGERQMRCHTIGIRERRSMFESLLDLQIA